MDARVRRTWLLVATTFNTGLPLVLSTTSHAQPDLRDDGRELDR